MTGLKEAARAESGRGLGWISKGGCALERAPHGWGHSTEPEFKKRLDNALGH